MSSNFLNDENKGDIIIYQSESGETKIDVRFQDETVWLTQAQLCELYQSSKANVSEHTVKFCIAYCSSKRLLRILSHNCACICG